MTITLKNLCISFIKRFLHGKLTDSEYNNGVFSSEHLIIGVLVLLIFILGVLVSIIGYILMQEISYTISPLSDDVTVNTLSVYCKDLSLSPDDDLDTFETKKVGMSVTVDGRGNYICSERNLTYFVEKIVERQLRLRQSKGLDNERYLSCGNESLQRKSGDQSVSFSRISRHQTYKESGLHEKIHWDKHQDRSYVDPLINYLDGEIKIPEGQTYYVYASVHFKIAGESKGDNKYKRRIFTLRLCRKMHDYEQTVLINTKRFSEKDSNIVSSLHLAGLLRLNRNDSIYVKVSNANKLILNSSGNSFGIYPL